MNYNQLLGGLITSIATVFTSGASALTKVFSWLTTNPLYTLIGFYVFMVALRGGSFKLGSKASTEVKK